MWGGTATLVEEASIGVESGADEYMFGEISAVAADGRRLLVADRQAGILRAYDYAGTFLEAIGRKGPGPGEFTGLQWDGAVSGDEAGNLYVLDDARRLVAFAPDGSPSYTVSVPDRAEGWPIYPDGDGAVWLTIAEREPDTRQRRYGVQSYNENGPEGAPFYVPVLDFEPPIFAASGFDSVAPLGPQIRWGPTPTGGVVIGASDEYRFEVHHPDGSVLVVEKAWETIAYPAEEIEWWRRFVVMQRRLRHPGWDWNGAEIPRSKPAFARIIADNSGGYWLLRPGPSVKLPDCSEDPLTLDSEMVARMGPSVLQQCWRTEWLLDAFDEEGRFLGSVEAPKLQEGFSTSGTYPRANLLFIDGDTIVAAEEGDDGVFRVKRYRLVLPE